MTNSSLITAPCLRQHANRVIARIAGALLLCCLLTGAPPVLSQSADDGFNPDANNSISALATQPDGKILIGGVFTSVGGQTRHRLARLHPDGRLDADFSTAVPAGQVNNIVVQPDGRIVIAGDFDLVDAFTRSHLARLNADGSVDTGFNPIANRPSAHWPCNPTASCCWPASSTASTDSTITASLV